MLYVILAVSLLILSPFSHSLPTLKKQTGSIHGIINKRSISLMQPKFLSHKYSLNTRLHLFPQIIFIGSCVAAVVTYVYNNIDSIREQQRVVTEKTMAEQSNNIRNAQQTQQEAIRKAQLKQQQDIEKARRQVEEATKK
mmetsp:Transcript_28277/g.38928  ORF Transcript_28277/g.38928 Transcript_28277/m.38928 type:complete len:139 (-) Transcript_28277:116-532(-)